VSIEAEQKKNELGLIRLAITMGDPAGIGPEVVLKALRHPHVYDTCEPTVFGDFGIMRGAADRLGTHMTIKEWKPEPWIGGNMRVAQFGGGMPTARDITVVVKPATEADLASIIPGELSAAAGRAAAESVICAAKAVMVGKADALVTAPINKEAIALGGYPYPGHTELLAEITGAAAYGMLLVAGNLRVIHVSTHVSLSEAIQRVRKQRILECIRLGHAACIQLGISMPRIAVAGLNPHAGEHGLFGSEEAVEIEPAISDALAFGIKASGPHAPDTVFARALGGEFDLVVAMYHDQGHIPVKLFGIDNGVNVSVGMPIIRVSVDHGTAFDIAGKNIAREASMLEAIRVASVMVAARRQETINAS
jgi:4-hydroxythreonine-4-phosphate dehydrogenase